jgi:hypothetical protein
LAVVYRHIRVDINEPFYIGIGDKENRAYSRKSRNRYWKNIAKKGYEVEILFEDLTWDQACEKEKEFIALYGRKDLKAGTLVNLTNGGEGALGRPMTERLKKVLKDSPNKFNLAEWQRENGAAVKGKKLGPQTKERKQKASKSIREAWSSRSKEEKTKQTVNFRKTNPNYKKQKCPFCEKEIQGLGAFKRFHGTNCKSNKLKL